jgi:hypothetical protein
MSEKNLHVIYRGVLREHTLLKHKEIAEFMKMNHSQVSNVLSRFKVGDDPTLTKWAETFCDK